MPTVEPHSEKLKYIFNNAKVGIAICNADDNRLEMVNPAFAAIHGYEPHELIGVSPGKVFAPECMLRLLEHEHSPSSCSENDVSFETTHIRKDGSPVHLSVHITVIKNEFGIVRQRIANIQDISEKKKKEEKLSQTEIRLSSLISTIPDPIWMKDEEGVYLFCNASYGDYMGIGEDEIIGKTDYDLYSPESADLCKLTDHEAIRTGKVTISEERVAYRKENRIGIMEIRKAPVYRPDGKLMGILGIARDITERKQMEHEIARQKDFQDTLLLGIAEAGVSVHVIEDGKYIYTNDIQKAKKYGYDETIFSTKPNFLDTIHPDDRAKAFDMYTRRLAGEDVPNNYELGVIQADGTRKEHSVSVIVIPNTDPLQTIVITQDITERKSIEKRIEHMAHHDALTELPNRILVRDRAERILAHAKRTKKKAALLFIDLDGFKTINDTLGHSVGDIVLKSVASRLKKCVRESDTLSRQGGDEFLILLSDISGPDNIIPIVNKLLNEFDKPFEAASHLLSTSASIGIAIYPEHGKSFELLLQSADTAMYKAKADGKNTYCFYNEQMNHNLIGQFKIQNDLKSALKNNEFVLLYQPQIDLNKNRISGAEALIRWNHPQLGMIPPMSFIPIAESSGLIVPIGEWIIREACRQIALWHSQGMPITVAVNISSVQFKRGNLCRIVEDALLSSKIVPEYLELELTESIMMHDTDNTLQSVRNLKELGIQLSIDDFGTGYSSLAYLKRFAVNKLKIDQSFVRDILRDQEDAVIVKTIIQMAKSLNLRTIAEGVEDQNVINVVAAFGCDEVQGYHFAKPMEAGQFASYYHAFFVGRDGHSEKHMQG